jgi:general secretion pathway protein C
VSRIRGGAFEGAKVKQFSDYQVIVSRNLFSSLGRIPGDEVQGTPDLDNDPVKTTLPLTLVGTVILKNELRSVATIEDKDENQVYPMRIDDELPGKIKILAIEPYKVVFRNLTNGRKEFVDMPEEGNGTRISVGSLSSRKPPKEAIEQVAPNQFNIPRVEIDKYLSNINDVLTQARAIPHFENGQPAGYKLIQIVAGSVYEKLGLKNNDILCGVNGENINDPARAFELMNQLKTASSLELCVKRDGRTTTQSYNFR